MLCSSSSLIDECSNRYSVKLKQYIDDQNLTKKTKKGPPPALGLALSSPLNKKLIEAGSLVQACL